MKKKTQTRLHHKVHHRAKMAVVPHKKNQYRPHLIRTHGLVAVVLIVAAMLGVYNLSSTGKILGNEPNISAAGLLHSTNDTRTKAGQAPLSLSDKLTKAAELKAQDMLEDQYWAHTAPDGTEPWVWFDEVDYSYVAAGENLARDFKTDQGVVAAWMNSKEHRENVLNAGYTEVGFGVVNGMLDGHDTQLVVAMYGAPLKPTVAGKMSGSFAQTPVGSASIMTRTGYYLQSMGPALLASLVLLLATALVAMVAHMYRKKLPKPIRQSWRQHHGLYKAVGTASLAVVVIALYSGGQI